MKKFIIIFMYLIAIKFTLINGLKITVVADEIYKLQWIWSDHVRMYYVPMPGKLDSMGRPSKKDPLWSISGDSVVEAHEVRVPKHCADVDFRENCR